MRTLASGLGLTEGPLWTSDGRLLVVSVSRGLVYEVDLDGARARPLVNLGGAPSGLAEDREGTFWVAQGGSQLRRDDAAPVPPSIQHVTGASVASAAHTGLTAPNDCVVGQDGVLWFTDPAGSPLHGTPEPGRVWTLGPGGALSLKADGVLYPNGIAFSPDLAALYVAETATRRVLRFPLHGSALGPVQTVIELSDGHPDGLAVDADGNIIIAATTAGAVVLAAPDGTEIDRITIGPGSMPTNVCFGGDDLATLFVTVAKGGRVLAVPRKVPGLALPAFSQGIQST
jgi:gluconolactonase